VNQAAGDVVEVVSIGGSTIAPIALAGGLGR
jgi:hypothetical protein